MLNYHTRFPILPWVRVPHLASHILGKVTRRLSDDWERMYRNPVYFAETFIIPVVIARLRRGASLGAFALRASKIYKHFFEWNVLASAAVG